MAIFGFVVTALFGPLLMLLWGFDALPWFAVSILCIAVCCAVARVLYKKYPQSEIFAVPLVIAFAIWAGSGCLALAMAA